MLTGTGGVVDVLGDPGTVGRATPAAAEKMFTTYDIQACLYDASRVQHLWDAIRKTVKPGDVVIDAGSGTGLLGMLAARAGAAKVYCVELNPEFIEVIGENARRNGLSDRIIAVNEDATRYRLDPADVQVDVLVSEVISGGFFYEPQLQIVNNLRQFLKPDGLMVPKAMKNQVELIDAQSELYGLTFTFDSRFQDLPDDRSLTTSMTYLSTEFRVHNPPAIASQVRLRATETGRANAVRIAYEIEFSEGIWVDKPTPFLLNPQVVYLPELAHLEAGKEYFVRLQYQAGDSPLRCRIDVEPAPAG